MHIVHIASELAPLAKVGGLADVLLGLSRQLSWQDHDVDIIIPKYDCMDSDEVRDLTVDTPELLSLYQQAPSSNTVWVGWVENLKVYFIEPHHPRHFFNRGCFYGCDDDLERYLYFSRATLEFLVKKGFTPDILHIHDWQTAAIAPLHKLLFPSLAKSRLIFTIHNIEYQGKCLPGLLDDIGLNSQELMTAEKLADPYLPKTANLLKGGIVFCDAFTTVSPNYAYEVRTVEGGRGLDSCIIAHQDKFSGILNGIDYVYWNPETDRYLPAHFSSRTTPLHKQDRNTLDKKAFIKKVLREKLSLIDAHRPIISCIARLVPQKGIDLIKHVLLHIVEKGGQFVLLGSSPIPHISAEFHALRQQFSEHPHVHLFLQHQEELAHLIYAGSDMFIVPSLFEPCGLTQLIAMRYGTIPIVRKTGGLADTVFDVDYSGRPFTTCNGYTFDFPDTQGIDSALERAISCWYHAPDRWRQLIVQAMQCDFSWKNSAQQYLALYQQQG